ncbi:CCR4-associated factor 1 [Populus alba x Populus x berolinensis]|nr:CCR4-associated factor 1 [Populus alba x Populus x berolinensis]
MVVAAAVAAKIIAVWKQNFQQEIFRLDAVLFRFPVVSFDTEFPGFFRNTPRDVIDLTRYKDLRHNVDPLRLIQFGITVADARGNIGGTWEFNLRFDLSKDLFVSRSIQFLQDNGIDFDNLRRDGIDFDMFAQLLSRVVARHQNLCWVTFHGLYDLSHTLRAVTNRPLPHSVVDFTSLLGIVFGDVVDIKYMARFCQGLRGGELGLAAIAKILNVERVGGAHQAGSDSLLTACVYTKMRMVYKIHETPCMGCLYGISARICKPIVVSNTNGHYFIPCFSTAAPFQRCFPPYCSGFMQAAPPFSHVL